MSESPSPDTAWVAGADGCRAGWVVVLREAASGTVRHRVVPSIEALAEQPEAPAPVGIDMIIGLPDAPPSGGRACDKAARRLLGRPFASSVFSPPAQATIAHTTYEEAVAANRHHSPDGVGLTKQTFHLFPKLRAVDAYMTPARQERLREVHPELAFFAMNGEAPLDHSKHDAAGERERIGLLRQHGFDGVAAALDAHAGPQVKRDDILDAYAACWTAGRLRRGAARRVPPDDPPRNAKGLRMEIWR